MSLLDTGSSSYIRTAAAEQLADVQKAHPDELFNLLGRIVPFLRSKKWDTRIAAAKAIGLIVANSDWQPDANRPVDKEKAAIPNDWLTFANLDVDAILDKGTPLLGSGGREYDQQMEAMAPTERMKMQQQALKRRIGMDFLDADDVLDDELVPPPKKARSIVKKEPTPDAESDKAPTNARMRALARRKAKFGPKSNSTKMVDVAPKPEPKDNSAVVVEHRKDELLDSVEAKDTQTWPFEMLCRHLVLDMFEVTWETRHGALLGLREIVRERGSTAGMVSGLSAEENKRRNATWLEDLACRFCCLFALDRFADYVADQVVAPVRESCAQAMGPLLLHLPIPAMRHLFDILCTLILQQKAEGACHGGMMGMRYLVSARPDFISEDADAFARLVECAQRGLTSQDDDVQALAAAVLLPITGEFVERRPRTEVRQLLDNIWSSLSEVKDELSTSIGKVMDLLARLCSYPQVLDVIRTSLSEENSRMSFSQLIPKLYPFLRHSITDVRKAVLRSLKTFLELDDDESWANLTTLRLVFQNIMLEQNQQVLDLSMDLWHVLLNYFSKQSDYDSIFAQFWSTAFPLLTTPIGTARRFYQMNENLLVKSQGSPYHELSGQAADKVNIDGPIISGDILVVDPDVFIRARVYGSTALGAALSLSTVPSNPVCEIDSIYDSPLSSQRLIAGLLLSESGNSFSKLSPELKETTRAKLLSTMELSRENIFPMWRDLNPILRAVRTQCQSLFSLFVSRGEISAGLLPALPQAIDGDGHSGNDIFTLAMAEEIAYKTFYALKKQLSDEVQVELGQALEDARINLLSSVDEARGSLEKRNTSVRAAAAAAYVSISPELPSKLNPIIRGLMDGIKSESNQLLHERTAKTVASLVATLLAGNRGAAAAKIAKNLSAFLCVDVHEAPEFPAVSSEHDTVFSLRTEEQLHQEDIPRMLQKERENHVAFIKRQGALMALSAMCEEFKEDLFNKLPALHEQMYGYLSKYEGSDVDNTEGQGLIDNMVVVKALIPYLASGLQMKVCDVFDNLRNALLGKYSVIRFVAAKCFATLCANLPTPAISYLVRHVIPSVSDGTNICARQGAIECIHHLMLTMGEKVLPYIVFFIVPVLGRMSDVDPQVRMIAATTFASIIKLVPLESGVGDPPDMPKEFLEGRNREREFISQMMDPTKVKPFELPITVHAKLRKYQQDGVNWLAFLNKYHLHGVLCDDMGLGKTLQTICMVASDHHMRAEAKEPHLPSLIISPTSLTGHWIQEFATYVPTLKTLAYAGPPSRRQALKSKISNVDVVVMSYETARNDVEQLSGQDWNYCVLDEGHIIKNASSKLSKAVKRYHSEHRLILSGTPIQNNVLELWSLFDFLMPGFLGSEKSFNERFSKPILATGSGKPSLKEQEAAALALEALHKQVLPFTMRRLKEDVLDDLPPKIIQDYYCDLSDYQRRLYNEFTKQQRKSVEEDLNGTEHKSAKRHIFQALQYMRKLCNHPAFVENTSDELSRRKQPLDFSQSPKLIALRQLLLDCGIGGKNVSEASEGAAVPEAVSQHRALIFCQQRDMLDLVQNSLLNQHMPDVSFLRMDGSTPGPKRQDIVNNFDKDPSIDALLLTTQVGGLGLNLTGADTVIFVEHDWNPMNDLQAMDRAHRIGQKRVVNVYRLITRDTLEERIMGLQQFKLNIASSVINQQNSGLTSMDGDQILDLFTVSSDEASQKAPAANSNNEANIAENVEATGKVEKNNVTGALGELWDESEYTEEYDLDKYIQNLKKSKK